MGVVMGVVVGVYLHVCICKELVYCITHVINWVNLVNSKHYNVHKLM